MSRAGKNGKASPQDPQRSAAGGGTCFFDMPLNSSPPVLNAKAFDAKLEAAKAKSITDFGIWGGLTPDNLDHMEELADRGVVGFKAFMCDSGIDEFRRADDYTLFRGMRKAKELRLPVAVHAENEEIADGLTKRARKVGEEFGKGLFTYTPHRCRGGSGFSSNHIGEALPLQPAFGSPERRRIGLRSNGIC